MSLHCERSTYGLTGFIFLLTICIKGTTGRQDITPGVTTTLEPYISASALSCPVIILAPEILYADYGKKVQFQGSVEAKLEYPTDGRWQKISNGVVLESIDTNTAKYRNTTTLPPIQLVINNADFDDIGEYRLQVRISNGWCSSTTLQLQHIYGVLGYNESCNHTRECDERKLLQCASSACLCNDLYYPYGQTCYPRNHLEANIVKSIINASSIYFEWKNSSHSDLIQEYTVSIIDGNGTTITNTSVGKQTRFNFQYEFIHGNIYYCIFSTNVKIGHTGELFTVIKEKQMVLAPLPPGQIDKHNSSFHPEKLHLKWTVPINNTKVDSYSVIIHYEYGEQHSSSWSNEVTLPNRFQPDKNYTVTLYAISYGSYSPNYTEVIHTLRTPVLTITPSGWHATPYLSNLEINCIIRNSSGFPPILETKWQRNKLDFNISDVMYNGSSLDLINPKLVINRVDFDRDDRVYYRCMARNSEGWGSSPYDIELYVTGSIKFQQPCNNSKECLHYSSVICINNECLCTASYYHKDKICKYRYYLRAQSINIRSSFCNISMTWKHPQDADLITGYEVFIEEKTGYSWKKFDRIDVGNNTKFTSPCTLQSGRLYRTYIRSQIALRNPSQNISVDSYQYQYSETYEETILEPRKPGAILNTISIFSADGLHLEWEKTDGFVNRYRVKIDDNEQETLDSKPHIDWNKLLLPGTLYNVTITAISYGFTTNYQTYGKRESAPASYWIMTVDSKNTGKAFMSYGDGDYVLTGDYVTTPPLTSPTRVYVGSEPDAGFNFVVIGTNGIIGLGETFNSESIFAMDSKDVKQRQILCPFWTDLQSKNNEGKVYYKTYNRGKKGTNVDSNFMDMADDIVRKHFKDLQDFKATWLVKVTWENMTLFGQDDQKTTFQCFLITDGGNTFAVINYIDINLKPIRNLPISIGYRYKDAFVKNSFTNQKGAFKMSFIPGNGGERGFWIYKMTTGRNARREEHDCLAWHLSNKKNKTDQTLSHVLVEIECPCDSRLLRFDPRYALNRFDETNRLACYASLTEGNNVECCYDMYADVQHLGPLRVSAPFAGTVLQYNPFFQRYHYNNHDKKPKDVCCSSGHCDWYYDGRPIPNCYIWSPFKPAINFGDPHITTFDGLDYTFNGYGEYTMIKINTRIASFILQARTELATTENGTTINATIFSAFAAKDQTGSTVQIEMSRDKKGMVIIGNGIDITNRLKNASYKFLERNLTISSQNRTIVATFLKSSNTIKISLGKRFLICETLINVKYKGMTTGLMGNFDGNKTNDFILPNGTMLPQNATNSERKIFYNFGRLWSVGNESLFQYGDELSYLNYSHPEFVPMFTDEVDTGRLEEAKMKCGSNASKACIADYLATGDIALAKVSGNKEHDSKSDIATIENEIPQIMSGNTTLYVELNKKVEFKFNVSDDGEKNPTIKFLKRPDNFELDNETNTVVWTPKNFSNPDISIVATDSQGAQSAALEYNILMCSGCGHNGECDYENTLEISNHAKRVVCKCQTGYTGERCDINTDGCSQNPCPLNRNCTDLSPEEEVKFGRGYNCSSCPPGFNEVENKCIDINECTSDANTCDKDKSKCENSNGGYICNCLSGYRKLNEQCSDIDECLEKRSGCEQLCQNTPGSFSCSCFPGFGLNDDNTTCSQKDTDICKHLDKQCQYACSKIEGNAQCICPTGYTLTNNGINCTDIDECSLATTLCDQECINLNGSFQCACRPGYSLEQDKTTCSRCELPNYGVNCSQVCECGAGVDRCDSVSGCVCLSGWTGKSCDVDIDECQENPNICGIKMVCVNKEGSYRCDCGKGLQRVENSCEDIDECADESLNDCPPETTHCVNSFGNYSCECRPGFQGQGSDCNDIDECKLGTNPCSQACLNSPGSYNCLCFFGFDLGNDRHTCEKTKDSCSSHPNLNCTYGCKKINENKEVCFCESGYQVQSDGSCEDINECLISSTCDHNCTNKKGSFTCSCAVGYRLGNDGKSCTVCKPGFYGENCETQCRCGRGSKECNNIKGCVCSSGWRGETCEEDINECDSSPCTGEHEVCLNTPGSFRCNCVPGFKNSSGTCEDIDECQEQHICHQLCSNTNGSYTCGCKDGYELINSKDCVDIDECAKDRCSKCSNWPGSFKCSCNDGYRLNTTTLIDCENIDECHENTHNCSLNATCTDTDGSFRCNCHIGTHGDGYSCTECKCEKNNSDTCDAVTGSCHCKTGWTGDTCSQDVDECKEETRTCNTSLHQVCVNDEGSSHCQCLYGGKDLANCNICNPGFYGENCETQCRCGQGSKECDNIKGCVCNPGWRGETCDDDINECNSSPCTGDHEVCFNTPGSFRCDCVPGFKNSSGTCEDINECQEPHTCHQLCTNTNGNYTCGCMAGYELKNSKDCVDIDECAKAQCSNCSNLPGTFKCSCNDGYRQNTTTLIDCENVDECQENTHNCSLNATCTDTDGSFKCNCHIGTHGDGYNCTVCPPFTYGEQCFEECKCEKNNSDTCDAVIGSCHCKTGWTGDTCSHDVDECKEGIRTCNTSLHQVCVDDEGSSHCECLYGGKDLANCNICNPGFHGENCKTQCRCGRGSKECDNIKGCVCYPGWRGETCDDDINECDSSPCTGDHEICFNTPGSFRCDCVPGFKNSSGTCEVCSPFTYGTECSEDCKCEKTKSEKCDAVTGNCHCQTGWTGNTCSQDVDECKEGTRTCNRSLHQVCVNNPGSSNCQCLYGGNNLTSCIRPKPTIHINTSQVKVKAEVRFDINASREDFVKHSEEWRKQIEETLMKFHRDTVPGFSTLVVLSIRLGSLWADYEIIGTKTQLNKNKFEAGVASSMSKILKGEHTFNILKQETRIIGVTMKDNNGSTTMTFTTPTSPCYLLKAFYECPSGYHCDDSLNKAECVLNDFSDLAIITISVGVGVPVLIAAIVIIILWKRYQRKARKLKEKSGHDETIPVTLAGKIPRPKHSPSSEYDFIDSRSLYDGRYTDLGCINPNYSEDSHRERRYQADDQFPIKRPNVGPSMTREY